MYTQSENNPDFDDPYWYWPPFPSCPSEVQAQWSSPSLVNSFAYESIWNFCEMKQSSSWAGGALESISVRWLRRRSAAGRGDMIKKGGVFVQIDHRTSHSANIQFVNTSLHLVKQCVVALLRSVVNSGKLQILTESFSRTFANIFIQLCNFRPISAKSPRAPGNVIVSRQLPWIEPTFRIQEQGNHFLFASQNRIGGYSIIGYILTFARNLARCTFFGSAIFYACLPEKFKGTVTKVFGWPTKVIDYWKICPQFWSANW